jgi:DNA helicase-2/ATP-dependent DNA helicase PcrA
VNGDLLGVNSCVPERRLFHTNEWKGERQTGAQWKGDFPDTVAHSYLQVVLKKLAKTGWDFAPEASKILMLAAAACIAASGGGGDDGDKVR